MSFKYKELALGLLITTIAASVGYVLTIKERFLSLEFELKNITTNLESTKNDLALLKKDTISLQDQLSRRGKPSHFTEDEWNLHEAMWEYEKKDYSQSLIYFGRITHLNGPDFVQWKYYESLAKFRLLQYRKYRKYKVIDKKEAQQIAYTLKELMDTYPKSKFSEGISYWYGQTLYHFLSDSKGAFEVFKKLKEDNPWSKWRQGTLYYMAMSLLDVGNNEDAKRAVTLLEELRYKFGTDLVKIVEEGQDLRVDNYVPEKIREIKQKYLINS